MRLTPHNDGAHEVYPEEDKERSFSIKICCKPEDSFMSEELASLFEDSHFSPLAGVLIID
jgi:hypothetical protein